MKGIKEQTKLWTTKDGREICICEMSDSHLLNTIKLVQRAAEVKRINVMELYITTPPPNGDMAQYCFDREFDNVLESTYLDYVPKIYRYLVLDAKRREIDIPDVNGLIADSILAKRISKTGVGK